MVQDSLEKPDKKILWFFFFRPDRKLCERKVDIELYVGRLTWVGLRNYTLKTEKNVMALWI